MLLKIEKDPLIDENSLVDNNSIDYLMNIKYFLETFKLVLVIFNVSYFIGIFWMIYCDCMDKYILDHSMYASHDESEHGDMVADNFIDQY